MKNQRILRRKYIKYILILMAGIFLGWLLFRDRERTAIDRHAGYEAEGDQIWTCSMHPHIRMEEPGRCPICGMQLIPLEQNIIVDSTAVLFTNEAAELANVLTTEVTRSKPVKEVRLYGKVKADERLVQSQTAHVPGRIEDLLVSYTGESVEKGQALAILYSPELITAQQELIEASAFKTTQPLLFEAAKQKLSHWKITDEQINELEKSGHVLHEFEVRSNTTGIVIQKLVNNGDHVAEGTRLFEVADLSQVWILFDAYESDLEFLGEGDRIEFEVQALPGRKMSGRIEFIDPVIDPVTRVAKVRIHADNQSGLLKPEMFVTGIVKTSLNNYSNSLTIPKSSILWTGKRSIVYVKDTASEDPVFRMREVELGPMLGSSYIVTGGLKEGEHIVTSGTFSVDAAAQLEGKPSMMNR